MTARFEGRIIEAYSIYESYEPNSMIQLKVRGEVAFTKDEIQTDPWQTWWEAFDEGGKRIGFDARNHSIAFWTKTDTAIDDFILSCGRAPSSSFNLRLKLSGKKTPWPGVTLRFIDDLYIPIRVAGSKVDPLPIPPEPPPLPDDVKPGPTPPPEPLPLPPPFPEPSPAIPGTPEAEEEKKKTWLWVGLAAVAVVGIVFVMRR